MPFMHLSKPWKRIIAKLVILRTFAIVYTPPSLSWQTESLKKEYLEQHKVGICNISRWGVKHDQSTSYQSPFSRLDGFFLWRSICKCRIMAHFSEYYVYIKCCCSRSSIALLLNTGDFGVPLLMRSKWKIPPGSTFTLIVSRVDLFPSFYPQLEKWSRMQ